MPAALYVAHIAHMVPRVKCVKMHNVVIRVLKVSNFVKEICPGIRLLSSLLSNVQSKLLQLTHEQEIPPAWPYIVAGNVFSAT